MQFLKQNSILLGLSMLLLFPMASLKSQTLNPERISTPVHFDVSKNLAPFAFELDKLQQKESIVPIITIHSLFDTLWVYLITKCFYDKTKRFEYKNLLNYRKELLNNKSSIAITDLGAGSQVMKTQTRVVKHIASHAGSTVFRSKLLLRLVDYFKFEHILELGTSLGIATYAMHLGNPKASITTIEGCPNTTRFTRKKLIQTSASHITLLNGDFGTVIPLLEQNKFDFIYIDGSHNGEDILSDAIEAFKILKVNEIHLEHCSLHYKMLDVFNDWNFDGKVSLGVIDQRIDNIETEEDIIKAIKPALDYFPKEKILLTSECGFGHVPIDIVRKKIKMLVLTAKKL